MTHPAAQRPVPGPPRPVPPPAPGPAPSQGGGPTELESSPPRFADLGGRPVAEHVAVFEAEHERLQRDLSTIDQL